MAALNLLKDNGVVELQGDMFREEGDPDFPVLTKRVTIKGDVYSGGSAIYNLASDDGSILSVASGGSLSVHNVDFSTGFTPGNGSAVSFLPGSCPGPSKCILSSVSFSYFQAGGLGGAVFVGQGVRNVEFVDMTGVLFGNVASNGSFLYVDEKARVRMTATGVSVSSSSVRVFRKT